MRISFDDTMELHGAHSYQRREAVSELAFVAVRTSQVAFPEISGCYLDYNIYWQDLWTDLKTASFG